MNLRKLIRNEWERTVACVCVVAGLVALYLGWRGVSDHTLATEQMPYIASGALLAVFLLGVGGTLWLSAGLRDSWRLLRELHDEVVSGAADDSDSEDRDSSAVDTPGAGEMSPDPTGVMVNGDRPLRAIGR